MTENDNDEPRDDECIIPGPVPKSVLNDALIDQPEHEKKAVREYVELEADETVTFLEKAKIRNSLR